MKKRVTFNGSGGIASKETAVDSGSETPRAEGQRITRSKHVPTPKFSDRKKALFIGETQRLLGALSAEEDSDLGPMSPLKFSNSPKRTPMKVMNTTSFRNILGNASPESDRSLSPDFERRFSHSERYEILPAAPYDKENHMLDEETQLSFPNGTPRVRTPAQSTLLDETNSNSLSMLMSSDLNIVDKKNQVLKTPGLSETNQKKEPKASFRKLSLQGTNATPSDENVPKMATEFNESKARTSLSFSDIRPISTKSFYSSAKQDDHVFKSASKSAVPSISSRKVSSKPRSSSTKKRQATKKRGNSIRLGNFNRGVFHKIKKPSAKSKQIVKKLSTSQILESASSLLNNSLEKPENNKSTPTTPQEPDMQRQLSRIKKILQNSKNPIEQARPLSLSKSLNDLPSTTTLDSDEFFSCDEESESVHNQSLSADHRGDSAESDNDDAKSEGGGRKFFKSNSNRRLLLEYKVVNNVSATVRKGGKISLNRNTPKKRKFKSIFDEEFSFESEQLEVNDIINKLNYSQEESNLVASVKQSILHHSTDSQPVSSSIQQQEQSAEPPRVQIEVIDAAYTELSNDEPIPMQSNVIVVDRLSPLTGTSEDSSSKDEPSGDVSLQSGYHQSPMTQIRSLTSELAITKAANVSDQLQKQQSQAQEEKLFPIFYKDHQRTVAEARVSPEPRLGFFARKREKRQKTWRPIGTNQYQIDAGQKEYGAHQCNECGLVYSVHEPEEELIHQNYHRSLHVLKFNGWADEAVVARIPEWDVTGRVLAVTMVDAKYKLQKVQEILAVVDRELGFAEPYQLLMGSIVYLAVARSIVLGACVAQPLQSANRLLTIEGLQGSIDCCTMETYPVKCGISRIWVSPNFRCNGIARTLLTIAKSHFVFGYPMSYDEIAFSAPTEAGKRLAESVTGRKDFLIYM